MNLLKLRAIAAATVATIVVSICLVSCQGRRMSNMQPLGETVEVNIEPAGPGPDAFQTGSVAETPDSI